MRRGVKCVVRLCDAGGHIPAAASSAAADLSGGVQVLVGNRRLLQEHGVAISPAAADHVRHAEGHGHTCVYIAGGGR